MASAASTTSTTLAPVASPTLSDLVKRLEGDWELEETGKAYWIGYTADMHAIAKHGDAAIAPLISLIRSDASPRTKYGAILALHCVGIRGEVVGRYDEAFISRAAREAFLDLLAVPDLQVDVLMLLIRDPWPTDVPRLMSYLENGTPNDWAFVKALQRYQLADAPVHQPLTKELASLRVPVVGATATNPGKDATVITYGTVSPTGTFKHARLAALRTMTGAGVVVEPGLREEEILNSEFEGIGDTALGSVLGHVTECDYLSLGDRLDYYIDEGKLRICSIETAKRRWLDWYSRQSRPLRLADPQLVLFGCFHGGVDRVTALIDANPDAVNVRGHHQDTPLHFAAENGLADIVDLLLGRGGDPKLVDDAGQLALHRAAAKGHIEVVERLVRGGSPVDLSDQAGATPLAVAAREGRDAVVDVLVKRGASLDIVSASAKGALDSVDRWLALDPSFARRQDGERLTPLHYAARFDHREVVRRLLNAGAPVDGDAPQGRDTPLHEAARKGHVEVVRELLHAGANVHAIGGLWGVHTALQEAAREGRLETVRVLLEAGARVNDNFEGQGRPALQWACAGEFREIVKLLLDHGADPDQLGEGGITALWWAIDARHNAEIERLLREHGGKVLRGPGHEAGEK